ncbi:hypothetical protein CN895_07750 [Bacillus cereus]|uniref:hypothetical protein n=1 Tax=Bacillus cereus TaxID=1396 RepID=UPI000BFD3493|nr:hypothetical protein [Bacillus cereus]PGK15233.1 hypothetical protein CN895_07750 [Bacillus cereus]
MIFECRNCRAENEISEINGSCKKCDNNDVEKFKLVTDDKFLTGMGATYFFYEAMESLNRALKNKKVFVIDPKSDNSQILNSVQHQFL